MEILKGFSFDLQRHALDLSSEAGIYRSAAGQTAGDLTQKGDYKIGYESGDVAGNRYFLYPSTESSTDVTFVGTVSYGDGLTDLEISLTTAITGGVTTTGKNVTVSDSTGTVFTVTTGKTVTGTSFSSDTTGVITPASGTSVVLTTAGVGYSVVVDGDALVITPTTDTTVSVAADGTIKGMSTTGSTVALAGDTSKEANSYKTLTVMNKTYLLDRQAGATLTYDDSGVSTLTNDTDAAWVNSEVTTLYWDDSHPAYTAKYSGSGDGVRVTGQGYVQQLSAGDSVTVAGGSTYAYTVSGTALEVKTVGTPTTTKYYTMLEDSVSFTGATTPTTSQVENGVTITTGFLQKLSSAGMEATATSAGNRLAVAATVVDGVYVLKDGSTSLSSTNAIGQFRVDSNAGVISYSAVSGSTTGQNIELGEVTTPSAYNWSVVGSAGKDVYHITADAKAVTLDGGEGNDIVSIAGGAFDHSIFGGAGNDTVLSIGTGAETLIGGEGNDSIEATGATGEKLIQGVAGNNSLKHTGTTASSVIGGSGNDTITAGSKDYVAGGTGADYFVVANDVAIEDYNYSEGDVLYDSTTAATAANIKVASDGKVSLSAAGAADVSKGTGIDGYYGVAFAGSNKSKLNVAWAGENAANIDLSSMTDAVAIFGDKNDVGDNLYGGSKADTIYGGASDSVYGGAGNDIISLGGAGAVVGLSTTNGKDTVSAFRTGFDADSADSIYLVDGSAADVTISASAASSGNLTVENTKNSSLYLATSGSTSVNNTTKAYELLINGAKVAVAANKTQILADSADYADFYFGTKSGSVKSGLSFANVSDDVNVNLADTNKYRNIDTLTGGSGSNTLIGGTGKETIYAGSGNSSLWGAAGNDVLVSDKNAASMFFFGNGDGKDTVSGFVGGTTETADALNFLGANISGINRTGRNEFKVTVGSGDVLTVDTTATGEDVAIQWQSGEAKGVAKIGYATTANKFTYDESVTAYNGGSRNDTLTVSTDANVWLDGSRGTSYGSIDVLDGSGAASGTSLVLAGDGASQTINAGRGDSSLWGGLGSAADTLKGSTTSGSVVNFFYGYGEGNDVINNSKTDDVVNLYNISLDQLTSAVIDTSKITITTNAGQTLTVNGTANTFVLAGGAKFQADRSTKTWSAAN